MRLAYVSGSGAFSQTLVADRSGARVNVAASAGWGLDPDWSPDGARVVFSNNTGLHTVGRDGAGSTRLLAPPSGTTVTYGDPSWSPDGGRIAFLSFDAFSGSGQSQIRVVNRDGSPPIPVGAGGELDNPTWSPDGSRIGFSRGLGQSAKLWTMRPDGSDARPLVGDAGPDRGTTQISWGSGPLLTRTLLPRPSVARLIASVARELSQARGALATCGTTALLKKRGCRDSFKALAPGSLVYRVTARAGTVRAAAVAVIASGRKAIPAAGTHAVNVKATKRGRKRLRKARKLRATLTVTFTDTRGNAAKRSTKVVLKRKTK